jgi:hypothetical protein
MTTHPTAASHRKANIVADLLTASERQFLAKHGIDESKVSDARGLGLAARRTLLQRDSSLLAIGTPCGAYGHRLRTSSGHCVMCDPKKIAFARRHRTGGEVYVAWSSTLTLTKVGTAGDAAARIAQLNSEAYGGGRGWQLVDCYMCDAAGKVEAAVHRRLGDCSAAGRYIKDGKLGDAYELFNCPAVVAVQILRDVLGLEANLPVPTSTMPVRPAEHTKFPSESGKQPWRKGDRVAHLKRPEWGIGWLTADGTAERVDVRFEHGGDKVIAPEMAHLVRL